MDNIFVDLKKYQEEINIRRRNYDYSLGGKTGFCFIEGKHIIKIYNVPKTEREIDDLSIYKSDRISFPIKYLYFHGKIIGEVMPYFKAQTLDKTINLKTNVEFLLNSFLEIIKEIEHFPNVAMYDLWAQNILFSSKRGMFIIDVTDWKEGLSSYIDYNTKYLERAVGNLLRSILFDDGKDFINMNNYYRILNNGQGSELMSIISSYARYDYHLLELIEAYKEFIRIYYDYDIKTISDMKKYTKIMKFS